ncbi:adenylate kinase family protein [Archaeoglobus profundus]|uniref:Putative adenylate kinase n=1 Tax=Archaeoglobus profundus (strain DSM 5631 / JCM 9629 / NBRC 100127 / Av18) TaxID=572546 RepID=D2RGC4_ARCPA|nr:adenylate kinase family protein [Archaeoglobus profundus]ADB57349.1 Adenylate kinase [Archaeoglobus profundus DSM 5631]
MLIALTGTPGVGKSTVAEILRKRGYIVLSVNELAEKFNCIIGEEEGCKIVDVEKLAENVRKVVKGLTIIEGHLSHLLNPDLAIVLRCNPLELKRRLERKGWSEEKILENVEAELVDVILIEALDSVEKVYEIDTTNLTPEEVANAVEEILRGESEKYKPGRIDWLSEVGDKLDELIRR